MRSRGLRILDVTLGAALLAAGCTAERKPAEQGATMPDTMHVAAAGATEEHPGVVKVNGIPFTYFAEGGGPNTCVIVGDGLPFYRVVSDTLKAHIRFVNLNSRLTTPEAQVGDVSHMTMDTLVDDVEGARKALGLGKICVVGHSISGLIALEYARRYPHNTTFVVMQSTPPFYSDSLGRADRDYWNAHATPERKAARAAARKRVPQDSIKKLPPSEGAILSYVNNASTYFHNPLYDPAWILKGDYWNEPAWGQLFQVIMKTYDIANGPPITTPVFLALGKDDYSVPWTVWTKSEQAKIGNLTVYTFDESGHYSALEQQKLFDQRLLGWMAGLK